METQAHPWMVEEEMEFHEDKMGANPTPPAGEGNYTWPKVMVWFDAHAAFECWWLKHSPCLQYIGSVGWWILVAHSYYW